MSELYKGSTVELAGYGGSLMVEGLYIVRKLQCAWLTMNREN